MNGKAMAPGITGSSQVSSGLSGSMLRWSGAVLSGLMLTASFPPFSTDYLAWICLLPLLKAIENKSPGEAFRLGYVAGIAHILTLMYWIVFVLQQYGDLPLAVGILALLGISFYLSLYTGFFCLLATRLMGLPLSGLFLASAWVALEYARGHLIVGFPWCLLGYTQYTRHSIIQIADIFGVYGVSFLVVLVNAVIFRLLFSSSRYGKIDSLLNGTIAFSAVFLAFGYGFSVKNQHGGEPSPVRTAVIQANIDQSVKWDEAHRSRTIEIYMEMSESSLKYEPDLVVWPETSVPFYFQDHGDFAERLSMFTAENRISLIFGSPAYEYGRKGLQYYNRAYLMPADNRLSFYDKVYLVPFGEYVPFKRILFFVNRLVPAAGDFTPGGEISPLRAGSLAAGAMICFEVIFPSQARIQALEGSDFFVNLTNDAWFGKTSAPHQHLAMAVFRSVENRKAMVRAANTGISACIDRSGRIKENTDLFTREIMFCEIDGAPAPPTFYARLGDLPALLLAALALTGFLLTFSSGRRTKAKMKL